ncbi:hypothetical protein SAMN04488074_110238 [Lentzea albidocapillata subsp. violacea]|uniref:AAA+ ATPase domain-containing protein n=1 Tax=Lentzea albidocapillata subsp. violacea TaxID=128104 RepID=A0A1G9JGZ0_9PSEU|nr:DNA/RNA helicase domain-containing protein [Lentzea albidocapillata]SDL36393.1 hypothetical protein SAMN04488074_110238 [Lentzea albidocapillata subsp. violacea]
MPLVQDRAASLLEESLAEKLHSRLEEAYRSTHFRSVGKPELESWRHSSKALLKVLKKAGLGECQVLLEHALPRSSLRVDAIVCGHHPASGRPSYVFVELKQWSSVHSVQGGLVQQHARDELRQHPSDQVRGYCHYVQHAVPALAEEKELIGGLAYLHNASRRDVEALLDHPEDHWGRLYTRDDESELLTQLQRLLDSRRSHEENAGSARRFLSHRARPSARLLEIARDSVLNRTLLPLVDQQQTAYQLVEDKLVRVNEGSRKKVVVVVGGPGSGKSAIALSLLGRLDELGLNGYHSTGSKAFTKTMRRYLDPGERRVADMFKYNNEFGADKIHELEIIISDEAQRLRQASTRSGSYGRNAEQGEPQIKELISAARVPVFLLDENQRVRTYEVGTVAEITRIAKQLDCEVDVINLRGQFRCGGSDAYDRWVDCLLGVADESPVKWSSLASADRFQVHVAGDPHEMEAWIRARKSPEETGRMTAGFCWDWPWGDRRARRPDIRIGDWERYWNYRRANQFGPDHDYWATDKRGVSQVGCIYTAQGFEYDWAGVIFGEDLVWRGHRWVPQPEKSFDPGVRGNRSSFPVLARNAYRVLLTRGMRGVTMFSVDDETQEHLRHLAG